MEELKEMWFPIAEAPDYYISNHGRVLSVKSGKPVFLKIGTNITGYQHYTLTIDGKRKSFRAHRLVAQYFIPNPDNLPEVDHMDKNRGNNRVTNLRWVTTKQNIGGSNNGQSKLTEDDVRTIRERKKKGESSSTIALDYPVNARHIRSILSGETWKHLD